MTTSATLNLTHHDSTVGSLMAELVELCQKHLVIPYYVRNWSRNKATDSFVRAIKASPEKLDTALRELVARGVFADSGQGYVLADN